MVAMDLFFPFDTGAGAASTEDAWRAMAATWAPSGVVGGYALELAAFGDSSGLIVRVSTGAAWVNGHYGEVTAQKTVSIATADLTNPRIDRIVVQLDTAGNAVNVIAKTGTPAPAPTAPALTRTSTTWEFSLAQVAVGANVATITAGNVTDERPIMTPYGIVRYPSTTARDIHDTAPAAGHQAQIGNAVYTHNGTTWGVGTTVQVDSYFTAGAFTWTKPTFRTPSVVDVTCIGGGGGGASGRKDSAGTNRFGGSGGGGGAVSRWTFTASDLGATEGGVVGAGGTGGPAQTVGGSDGTAGNAGGVSYFGNWLQAHPGGGGVGGGSVATPTGGSGGVGLTLQGNNGGQGAMTSAAPALTASPMQPGGGGGGAAIDNTDSARAASAGQAVGGTGIGGRRTAIAGGAAGTGATGNPGSNGNTGYAWVGGSGGGGGAAHASGAGTAKGGNGGLPGGGGGGGGAALTTAGNSGAGGDGAAGAVYVLTYF